MPVVRIDQLNVTLATGDPASVRVALRELPAMLAAELRQSGSATSDNPLVRQLVAQVASAIRRHSEAL